MRGSVCGGKHAGEMLENTLACARKASPQELYHPHPASHYNIVPRITPECKYLLCLQINLAQWVLALIILPLPYCNGMRRVHACAHKPLSILSEG